MATKELEVRIKALETEVERLKRRFQKPVRQQTHWLDDVYGAFANDPDFLEAMRLGRQYRKSLAPKPRAEHEKHSARKK